MSAWYVGIDPGNEGALAFYRPATNQLVIHDTPTHQIRVAGRVRNRLDVHRLALILLHDGIRRVLIEEVHALPKQGISSTFTFGFGAGALQGAVAAMQLPMELVTPQHWKRCLGLSGGKDESRRMASRELPAHTALWPLKKHHGRAEAALLALLCAKNLLREKSA